MDIYSLTTNIFFLPFCVAVFVIFYMWVSLPRDLSQYCKAVWLGGLKNTIIFQDVATDEVICGTKKNGAMYVKFSGETFVFPETHTTQRKFGRPLFNFRPNMCLPLPKESIDELKRLEKVAGKDRAIEYSLMRQRLNRLQNTKNKNKDIEKEIEELKTKIENFKIIYSELIDFAYYEKSIETIATKKGEETIKTMELIPVISLVDFKKIDDYLMCFTPYKIKAHIDMFKARIARMMAKLRSPMDYMIYLIIGAIAIAIVWIVIQNTGSTGLDLSPETIAAIKGTATTVADTAQQGQVITPNVTVLKP